MNGLERHQFYGRMFKPAENPLRDQQEADLVTLGMAMKDLGIRNRKTADSGFTYFGQFIDHDLTQDTTKLAERNVEPRTVRNYRMPRLDLELIYGNGPARSPHLYQDGVRLKIGKTAPSSDRRFPGGTLRDIARKEDYTPLHADPDDPRNLENLIVMQIHVLFMKFHNAAVDQCEEPAFQALPLSDDIFTRAQQLVRWHYQYLVRQVFLYQIAMSTIVNEVLSRQKKIDWFEKDGLFIPAEFSLAAFRFGHSMVQAAYGVNAHHPNVPLQGLMAHGDPAEPLREDWLFEWGRLFSGDLLRTQPDPIPSSPINTSIVEPLHHLPEYTRRQFSDKSEEPQPRQLPSRTLLRGARAGLPSGQEVAKNLQQQGLLTPTDLLDTQQLTNPAPEPGRLTNDESGKVLAGFAWMLDHTPLYYYLLKEAEVLGSSNRTLGPAGSAIVAEVIETVLRSAPESYVMTQALGPNWNPPPIWRFRNGGNLQPIVSFRDLVKLVGDDLPQGC